MYMLYNIIYRVMTAADRVRANYFTVNFIIITPCFHLFKILRLFRILTRRKLFVNNYQKYVMYLIALIYVYFCQIDIWSNYHKFTTDGYIIIVNYNNIICGH